MDNVHDISGYADPAIRRRAAVAEILQDLREDMIAYATDTLSNMEAHRIWVPHFKEVHENQAEREKTIRKAAEAMLAVFLQDEWTELPCEISVYFEMPAKKSGAE